MNTSLCVLTFMLTICVSHITCDENLFLRDEDTVVVEGMG